GKEVDALGNVPVFANGRRPDVFFPFPSSSATVRYPYLRPPEVPPAGPALPPPWETTMAASHAPHPSQALYKHRLSRRSFLQIGTLSMGGLTLPQLLRAEATGGTRPKSVILIYLVGGPPHQDMFDLKPDAPKEIAGPWRPIASNVPGI